MPSARLTPRPTRERIVVADLLAVAGDAPCTDDIADRARAGTSTDEDGAQLAYAAAFADAHMPIVAARITAHLTAGRRTDALRRELRRRTPRRGRGGRRVRARRATRAGPARPRRADDDGDLAAPAGVTR